MNKKYLIFIIPIAMMLVPTVLYFTDAQISETNTRMEYVYCPIDIEALDKSITYEINGCPTIRIYVENYDRLSALQKLDVDSKLKLDGFIAKEDFKIDELTGRVITDTIK